MGSDIKLVTEKRRSSRRGKDYIYLYDLDFPNRSIVLRLRTQTDPIDNNISTPITQSLRNRFITGTGACKPNNNVFQPRIITACFSNENTQSSTSEYSVPIPYRPATNEHRTQISEIRQLNNVLNLSYTGERHTVDVRNYL